MINQWLKDLDKLQVYRIGLTDVEVIEKSDVVKLVEEWWKVYKSALDTAWDDDVTWRAPKDG